MHFSFLQARNSKCFLILSDRRVFIIWRCFSSSQGYTFHRYHKLCSLTTIEILKHLLLKFQGRYLRSLRLYLSFYSISKFKLAVIDLWMIKILGQQWFKSSGLRPIFDQGEATILICKMTVNFDLNSQRICRNTCHLQRGVLTQWTMFFFYIICSLNKVVSPRK